MENYESLEEEYDAWVNKADQIRNKYYKKEGMTRQDVEFYIQDMLDSITNDDGTECLTDALQDELSLKDADLHGLDLSNLYLCYMNFENCNLSGVNFSGCEMNRYTSFKNANLENANLIIEEVS